jgi:DNA primase
MTTTSVIDTIKEKVDIADEVSLVVALQKSGKSLKGLCPFHNERSPSFYVFKETQTWHCFGCNEGGDIFSFVQKQQSLDFRDALQYLAEKAGVPLEEPGERSEEDREISVARERLLKLNEEALLWFHQMLLRAKEAGEARTYVQSRGISMDSIIAFGLGYAGEQWDGLSRYLLSRGYTEHELVSGGLARWRENEARPGMRDGLYDYFRHRLIFPIRDQRGRVIGFGGRALGDSKPKYLNSPQTLLFEKNNVLYALDMAKDTIKQVGQVVIVEGYVDAVIAHQYGTRQTVACIGSAITEKHIQQLKKLTKQVTLALDPDAAGSAATEHGIQEALKGFDRTIVPVPLASSNSMRSERFERSEKEGNRQRKSKPKPPQGIVRLEEQVDAEINILQLPPGEDPDEVIRRDPSTWFYAVAHPLPLIDYYFVVKTEDLNLREPHGKTQAARRLLPVIAMISDRIKRDAYLRKLAGMINLDERSLYSELQRVVHQQHNNAFTADFGGQQGEGRVNGASGRNGRPGGPLGGTEGPHWGTPRGQNVARNALIEEREETAGDAAERPGQTEIGLDRNRRNTLEWEDYLIGLLLQNPGLGQYVCGIINDGDFAGTDTRELYHILNSIDQRDAPPSLQPVEQFVPSALLPTIARVTKRVESKSPLDGAGLIKDAIQCATRLKRTRLLQLNTELQYLFQDAVESGDKTAQRQFQRQLLDIYQQLRTIDAAMSLQG